MTNEGKCIGLRKVPIMKSFFFFSPIKIVNLINLYYKLERQTFGE
jgi:hypothetical protein